MLIAVLFNTEIFMYGGQVGNGQYDGSVASQKINVGLDEVYILSLPSFVWFKANYTSSDPRIFHTCNIVGNRQMLSIGGLNPAAANLNATQNNTDPFWEGMKVFDLTALQWTNYYNATAAPYLTPNVVASHYAAGTRYPSTWSSNDLKDIFLKRTSNASTATEPSTSALPQLGRPDTRKRTGVVVGGVVGGVAAVVFVIVALYLLARKRANATRRAREEIKTPPTYNDDHPDPIEGVSEADSRQALPHEVGRALPHEADSWQALPHEVGQTLPPEMGQALPHEVGPALLHEAGLGHANELLSPTYLDQRPRDVSGTLAVILDTCMGCKPMQLVSAETSIQY